MTYSSNTGGGAPSSAQYVDTGTTPGSGAEILRDGSDFYTTATTRVEQAQRIDVTEQIRQYNELYGGSDNTQAGGLAASKSLNYAPAPTMQQAQRDQTTVYPYQIKLASQVGLFGAENYYVRVDVDLLNSIEPGEEELGWVPGRLDTKVDNVEINNYDPVSLDFDRDPPPTSPSMPEPNAVKASTYNTTGCCAFYAGTPQDPILNCYYPAQLSNPIPNFEDPVVSVELENVGVDNIYIDTWLEPMLYTRTRKMWGYDKMYIRPKDFFYVGVHARNTRHLPYNINVKIGNEFKPAAQVEDKNFLTSLTDYLAPVGQQSVAAPVKTPPSEVYIEGPFNVAYSSVATGDLYVL